MSYWTDADKSTVADLLLAGLSASKIAAQLNCTRNAVHGVVNRDPVLKKIGLQRAPIKSASAPQAPRTVPAGIRRRPKPTIPRPPVRIDPVAPEPLNLLLADLGGKQCRWPVNDPPKGEPYLFCGHVRFGPSYCEFHTGKSVRIP